MKRKHVSSSFTAATSSSKKRVKHARASSPQTRHPHGEVDYEKEYKVKAIIDEKGSKYLIDWEPDEETGQIYQPTWEPKANANKEAKADWYRKKAEDRSARTSHAGPASGVPKKRGRGRPSKAKSEWHPPASWNQSGETQIDVGVPPRQPNPEEPEIVESPEKRAVSGAEQDSDEAIARPLLEPIVVASNPPSSFQAGTYQKFVSSSSHSASNSAGVASSSGVDTAAVHQSQTVQVNFGDREARVIADSQSLVEFSISAPVATEGDNPDTESLAVQRSEPCPQVVPAPSVSALQTAPRASPPPLNENAVDALQSLVVSEPENSAPDKSTARTQDASSTYSRSRAGSIDLEIPSPPGVQHQQQPQQAFELSQEVVAAPSAALRQQTPQAVTDNDQSTKPVSGVASSIATSRPSIHLEAVNGVGSVVHEDTISRTRTSPEKSTTSPFPFHTQLIRPGTSTSQASLLIRSKIQPYFSGPRASSLPAPQSALQSSSAVPSIPSRFTGTLGESAPPRPDTPPSEISFALRVSGMAMDTSQASVKSTPRLIDTLNAICEQSCRNSVQPSPQATSHLSQQSPALLTQPPRLVSKLVAEEQDRRSPSAVPAMEPVLEFSQEEQNTSERYPTLFPRNEMKGALQRTRSTAEGATLSRQQSRAQSAVQAIHVVPIGLIGQQRDESYSIPSYRAEKKLLDRFSSTADPDTKLVAAIEAIVQRLKNVAMHMDLQNDEAATQYDVAPASQVSWDLSCSGKFRFLQALLDELRDQTVHVAIVVRPGRIMGILATFLRSISVPHRRLPEVATSSIQSEAQGLMITLVSTEDEVGDTQPSPADMLIAFEPTVDDECLPIRALMQKGIRSPVRITLVPPCTIEHVEQSISPALAPLTRLRTLISGVRQYQTHAGRLDIGQVSAEVAAKRIAEYLVADERGEWPIEDLEPLENLDSQTESDIEPPQSVDTGSNHNKRSIALSEPAGASPDPQKRQRLEGNDMDQTLELPTTINPQNLEVTHISDFIAASTQSNAQLADEDSAEDRPLTHAEKRLQAMLKDAQSRLAEHVRALGELQYRYEEQRAELVTMTGKRNEQALMAQTATGRMTDSMNNGSKLKAERTELMRQLDEANAKLLDHSVPERREFEALRLRTEQVEKEKRLLEEKLRTAEENIEYFRTAYQDSSQSAQNLASQNTELDNEVAVLRNKATGEQAKLRQLGYDEQTRLLRSENKKLKATLKTFEAANKFKDEEIARLKEVGRGRIGTRGSSIPRTPRLGSPAKMDGLKGRGSRPGSPAPGELRAKGHLHPLSRAS
ncbi:hypothetical protein EJ03DRAFT_73542 [Teratosphaeria nubilosa]|uniref:Chromo domain-containing protein n=1 Tax=Teratosphaeria nubilosa TaxID=161662 RepID=A0A6G1LLZ2_9PEZI|nr:hypothetical protein EJ03DRAFT_73542 [Teratosphaeria nubilosa]